MRAILTLLVIGLPFAAAGDGFDADVHYDEGGCASGSWAEHDWWGNGSTAGGTGDVGSDQECSSRTTAASAEASVEEAPPVSASASDGSTSSYRTRYTYVWEGTFEGDDENGTSEGTARRASSEDAETAGRVSVGATSVSASSACGTGYEFDQAYHGPYEIERDANATTSTGTESGTYEERETEGCAREVDAAGASVFAGETCEQRRSVAYEADHSYMEGPDEFEYRYREVGTSSGTRECSEENGVAVAGARAAHVSETTCSSSGSFDDEYSSDDEWFGRYHTDATETCEGWDGVTAAGASAGRRTASTTEESCRDECATTTTSSAWLVLDLPAVGRIEVPLP